MSTRTRSIYIFENISREKLFVSKNHNFQTLTSKDWWKDVHHIIVKHFDSADDQEVEMDCLKSAGTKWNSR